MDHAAHLAGENSQVGRFHKQLRAAWLPSLEKDEWRIDAAMARKKIQHHLADIQPGRGIERQPAIAATPRMLQVVNLVGDS
jgi:hypothetical protein